MQQLLQKKDEFIKPHSRRRTLDFRNLCTAAFSPQENLHRLLFSLQPEKREWGWGGGAS